MGFYGSAAACHPASLSLSRRRPVKEPQSELTALWRPDNNPLDPTPTNLFCLLPSSSLYFFFCLGVGEIWQIFPAQRLLHISAISYVTTDLAHLLFPRLFLWRACVRKGLTNTDEKAAFSFVLFPTEAAVFELRERKKWRKITCGKELLSFFS